MIDAVKYATENFNPRSPRGERRKWVNIAVSRFVFQSMLSVRRATQALIDKLTAKKFQSTLSVRRATFYRYS